MKAIPTSEIPPPLLYLIEDKETKGEFGLEEILIEFAKLSKE